MVNYAKLIVRAGYRGIEPSSSLFLQKFPSGQLCSLRVSSCLEAFGEKSVLIECLIDCLDCPKVIDNKLNK